MKPYGLLLTMIFSLAAIGQTSPHELGPDGLPVPKPKAHVIDGTVINVTGGEVESRHAPIYLPYDGEAIPEGIRVAAIQVGTGLRFPAMVKDGLFVFVPGLLDAGGASSFQIEAQKLAEGILPVVRLEKKADADIIEVFIEDKLFTAYHYGKDAKKPFLWPVNSYDGVPVTRDYPMDQNGTPKDHPHHRSWWAAYGEIGGADCWTEGGESGKQVANEVTFGSGDAYGWILSTNTWTKADGSPVVTETREYRFYAGDEEARLTDMRVTFKADHGEVHFKDTKEGGICAVRIRQEMLGKEGITNSLGDVGEENTWGKPAAWCDYSGPIEGHGRRGIAIMDNPGNLRHPCGWHVRQYGLMGANPFGYSYFREKEYNKPLMPENGDYLLEAGKELTFNYRVYVHRGDAKMADVADRYSDYVKPPTAAWDKQ